MRTILCRVFAVLSLLVLFSVPPQVIGWGHTGHEAVAYIAWQQMTPATRARALELLKKVPTLHNATNTKSIPGYAEWVADLPSGLSQDKQDMFVFMRAATWADTIKHEWLSDSDTPPLNLTTEVNIGYTDTASHGYWHFVDNGFTSDHSTVPSTPKPNAATQIVALRQDIASDEGDVLKSYDLIWLLHLVGDIHQPLHGSTRYYANISDIGGNDVKIKLTTAMKKQFEGTQSKTAPTKLHEFWDDLPGEGQPAAALDDAAAFADPLPAAPTSAVSEIDPANWTSDSFVMAKKDAYKTPIGKAPTPPAPSTSYAMTTVYYNRAMKDAKSQIALAGARLAKLLNENLK